MGLNYSIVAFVRKAHIANAFDWLFKNMYAGEVQSVEFHENILKLKTHRLKVKTSDTFEFDADLIFDIDPVIINSFYDENIDFRLELFKDDFLNYYLGDGKIFLGSFDSCLKPIDHSDIYKISFIAVTSSMSLNLIESESIHHWIQKFSEVSKSILTCINKEHIEYNVLYENGYQVSKVLDDNVFIDDYVKKNYI